MADGQVTRDRRPLGTADNRANGAFQRKFEPPELPRNTPSGSTASATDALNVANTPISATRVFADFERHGQPKTLKVRSHHRLRLVSRRRSVFCIRRPGKSRRTVASAARRALRLIGERASVLFPLQSQRGTDLAFRTRTRPTCGGPQGRSSPGSANRLRSSAADPDRVVRGDP